jgi:protein-disulfide isomerase
VRPKLVLALAIAAGAVAVGLIVASLVGGDGDSTPPSTGPVRPAKAQVGGIPQDGTALGKPEARRTLAVYADVQCPFCARWDENDLPAIVDEYVLTGKLRLVFRGIAFIGPESELGLRAVYAAGLQDRLWNLVNVLYANQGGENSGWLTKDSLRRFGGAVPGLDVDRMLSDLDSDEVEREIDSAEESAQVAGVLGTPSFELGPTGGQLLPVTNDELSALLAG